MSLRLRIAMRIMAWAVKPLLGGIHTPQKARDSFERTARLLFRIPPLALFEPTEFDTPAGPRPALWSRSGPIRPRHAILYLHGGGYVTGSPHSHRVITARLARLTGTEVFAPDYRLAPEHPYPAALQDAEAAWDSLLARGIPPENIVIGGDSAGGGLALALLARLCARGQPPAAAFAFSPWTDLTLSGESLLTNGRSDVILLSSRVVEMRDYYANGADPRDPGLSPLLAAFPDCPPVLIQVSATEILADDARRMADRLRAQGAEVRLETWDDAPHVWQVFDGTIPEAREALENTARFIKRAQTPGPVTDAG